MRAFIAFEIPTPLKEAIGSFQVTLKKKFPYPVSWAPKENFHITVWFLGELDPGLIPTIGLRLKGALEGESAFEAQTGGLAWMPPKRPRVIYLEVHDNGGLQRVALKVKEALWETVPHQSFDKPFLAHITLGRVKQPQAKMEERLKQLDAQAGPKESFWVRGLTVFESQLSPKGSSYRPLSYVPFKEQNGIVHS